MTTDVELNYWGERFVASTLSERMQFGQFLALTPALRERRLAQQEQLDALRSTVEPKSAATCGGKLVEPIKPPKFRRWARPWFFGRRR